MGGAVVICNGAPDIAISIVSVAQIVINDTVVDALANELFVYFDDFYEVTNS